MVWFLSLLFIVLVCAALFYLWRAIGYRPHKHAAIDAKKAIYLLWHDHTALK